MPNRWRVIGRLDLLELHISWTHDVRMAADRALRLIVDGQLAGVSDGAKIHGGAIWAWKCTRQNHLSRSLWLRIDSASFIHSMGRPVIRGLESGES